MQENYAKALQNELAELERKAKEALEESKTKMARYRELCAAAEEMKTLAEKAEKKSQSLYKKAANLRVKIEELAEQNKKPKEVPVPVINRPKPVDINALRERINHTLGNDANKKQPTEISMETPLQSCEEADTLYSQLLEVLKSDKKLAIYSCAKAGKVYGFSGNKLVVVFMSLFQSERLMKPDFKEYIEDMLSQLARRTIEFVAVTEKELGAMLKRG